MNGEATVFIVDDDEGLRTSLMRLMASVGLRVEAFPDAETFLQECDTDRPGCLILDIQMPGISGLELQAELVGYGCTLPVIIISAHGDVEQTVRAMKAGAVDFLKKPYQGKVLLERVRQALDLNARLRREHAARASVLARLAALTSREREVMAFLVRGKSAKQIAFALGLSSKTVDVHRGHIMTKLQADSVVDLVHMWTAEQASGHNGSPMRASDG
ncbi:MAG: response regulator transcription factor [Phycisphaerae bacterium]